MDILRKYRLVKKGLFFQLLYIFYELYVYFYLYFHSHTSLLYFVYDTYFINTIKTYIAIKAQR